MNNVSRITTEDGRTEMMVRVGQEEMPSSFSFFFAWANHRSRAPTVPFQHRRCHRCPCQSRLLLASHYKKMVLVCACLMQCWLLNMRYLVFCPISHLSMQECTLLWWWCCKTSSWVTFCFFTSCSRFCPLPEYKIPHIWNVSDPPLPQL